MGLRTMTSRTSRRTRLLLAALVWSGVGLGLLVTGFRWVLAAHVTWAWQALVAALVIGWAKGRYVMARSAEANARRIEGSAPRRFIGAAFSVGMWLTAVFMMGLGAFLRHSPMPRVWLGLIYAAVGMALFLGSLVTWSHWWRCGSAP